MFLLGGISVRCMEILSTGDAMENVLGPVGVLGRDVGESERGVAGL